MRIFEERSVSYLPLSHIAGQMLDIYMAITVGGTVYFAQPDALKGSLVYTLRDVKPTCFLGVPRVWEKIHENIEKVFGGLSGAKLFMLNWARKIAHKHIIADNHGLLSPAFALAKTLVLNKLHKEIGLEKSRILVSGAAPINNETLEFFNSLGLPIMETVILLNLKFSFSKYENLKESGKNNLHTASSKIYSNIDFFAHSHF